MTRMLWVACLGLLAGVLSAAGPAQDPSPGPSPSPSPVLPAEDPAQDPPLFIPNDSWDGLPVIGDPGRAEREFKFTIHGGGLSDFNNAALATQIRLALAAAIGTVSWQAPPLVGFPSSPYQLGVPSNPVFLDIYYDSQEGVNYLSDTAYRFRMRFSGVDVIQGLQPQRLEYQSHFDQTPFVDGFRTRTESRLELARNQSIADRLNAFVRNAQSGLFESNVMAPSFGLVDFYRRRTQQDPRLVYLPNLVLESDRGRVHFTLDLANLQIGVGVTEVFLVTMDTSRVYLAADYLPWLRREVPVKPDPLTVLNEVEVEFDRSASVPLDQAIAQAQSVGDMTRLLQLTQVLNAFLADQRTVMDTILARFAEISRENDDANYLVCEPGVNSKYRQAFEIVLGSFAPARLSVRGAPSGEGFEITVTAEIGRSYRLQASSNLPTANWEDIAQFTLTQPTTNLVDATATNFPQRFYRAVSP